MNRHAYLVIAHNEPWLLQTLVSLIDDERNDIFIAVDSRTDIGIFKDVKAVKSRLEFTRQCNNRWGSVRQIETEYVLFEAARNTEHYQYYHLLSGQDMPIKSQDYIHNVCDKLQGKEFVGFLLDTETTRCEIKRKTELYYILQNHFRCDNLFEKAMVKPVQKAALTLQRILGIKCKYPLVLKKGCNWVSITDAFCQYLLEKKDEVMRMFNHTFCPDEIFLQTLLWNSPFRDNIYDINDEYLSCRRMIDWTRGNPYVWQIGDYNQLMGNNECFFARKFSSKDKAIVEAIVKKLI